MSKQNQKRRARVLRRKHESQRCWKCRQPGATEPLAISVKAGPKGGWVNRTVFFHRDHLPPGPVQ